MRFFLSNMGKLNFGDTITKLINVFFHENKSVTTQRKKTKNQYVPMLLKKIEKTKNS